MIRAAANLVTGPTSEPVTLGEVKLWLKIDTNDEDALIASLITAARESAEKYLKRALMTQIWALTVDLPYDNSINYLPAGVYDLPVSALYGDLPSEIDLPYKPLQSITSVVTYDTSNNSSTYSSSNYFADTANGRMILNNTAVWPSNMREKASLVVTYVCGYSTAANVPHGIKNGIKMHVQRMYDERIVCDMPPSCAHLYDQYKIYG